MAPRGGDDVQPLAQFLASVRAAQYGAYASRNGAAVADAAAFAEMKSYILQRYANIDVRRVTQYAVDAAGSVFDCLPRPDAAAPPPMPPGPSGDPKSGDRPNVRHRLPGGEHSGSTGYP